MLFNTKTAMEDFVLFVVGNFTALIFFGVIGIIVLKKRKKKQLERKNNPTKTWPTNKKKKNIDEIYMAANSKKDTTAKDVSLEEMADKEKGTKQN